MKANENTPEIITAELSAPIPVAPVSIQELRKKRSDLYHKVRYYSQKKNKDPKIIEDLSKQLEAVKVAIQNYQTK